jgi:hypothetical protein
MSELSWINEKVVSGDEMRAKITSNLSSLCEQFGVVSLTFRSKNFVKFSVGFTLTCLAHSDQQNQRRAKSTRSSLSKESRSSVSGEIIEVSATASLRSS